jgi:hypothetical protein
MKNVLQRVPVIETTAVGGLADAVQSHRAAPVRSIRLGAECRAILRVLAAVEVLYSAESLPATVHVPSVVDPSPDRALATRGNTRERETFC